MTKQMGGVKQRSSNLELYRILCMLAIVAHHFVVNSGYTSFDGPLETSPTAPNSVFLWLFGMWGKTGINCFLMITGYFMCTSRITVRKFIKLMLWIYFYRIIIFGIFLYAGYESLSAMRVFILLMPVWGFDADFTSCFIGFWLTIPFWNILVHNMTHRQHLLLLFLLVGMYSVLGSVPYFGVTFNYVTWFGVIYVIASYIRLYPHHCFGNTKLWAVVALSLTALSVISVVLLLSIGKHPYFFVSDSNRILALLVAVSSFMCFRNINISYSKTINAIGGSTFGVLLIHANSDAMRTWLWKNLVDCVGHYALPLVQLAAFSVGVVLLVFFSCILIDRLRIKIFEKPFFRWYDIKPRFVGCETFLKG